jgi:hypothetical protein
MSWHAILPHARSEACTHWMAIGDQDDCARLQIWFFGSPTLELTESSTRYFDLLVEQVHSAIADLRRGDTDLRLSARNMRRRRVEIGIKATQKTVRLLLPSVPPSALFLKKENFVSALSELSQVCTYVDNQGSKKCWQQVISGGAVNPLWHHSAGSSKAGSIELTSSAGFGVPTLRFVVHEATKGRRFPNDLRFSMACDELLKSFSPCIMDTGQVFNGGRRGVKLAIQDGVSVTVGNIFDDDAHSTASLTVTRSNETVVMRVHETQHGNWLSVAEGTFHDGLSQAIAVALAARDQAKR